MRFLYTFHIRELKYLKIKISNDKSIQWTDIWLNNDFPPRTKALKIHHHSKGNPYFTFSMQSLPEESMYPAVKSMLFLALPKKINK